MFMNINIIVCGMSECLKQPWVRIFMSQMKFISELNLFLQFASPDTPGIKEMSWISLCIWHFTWNLQIPEYYQQGLYYTLYVLSNLLWLLQRGVFCRFLHLYVFHSCCETQRLKSLNYLGWVSSFSASGIQV